MLPQAQSLDFVWIVIEPFPGPADASGPPPGMCSVLSQNCLCSSHGPGQPPPPQLLTTELGPPLPGAGATLDIRADGKGTFQGSMADTGPTGWKSLGLQWPW